MTILVTGATGFLGMALVRRLLRACDGPLRLLLRPSSDTHALDALREKASPGAVELFASDLDSADAAAAALAGVRLVYHLAAAKSGDAAQVFAGTLATSHHLLDAMLAMPQPPNLVLASSFGVYGTAALATGARVDEDTPLEPHPGRRDVYSHAKLEQERMFRDAHRRHGLPLLVLRPGVIYGPGRMAPSQRIGFGPFGGVFALLGADNPLPLTHVENCAEAFRFAAGTARFDGSAYDVVDTDRVTCRQYLRRYRHAIGGFVTLPVPRMLTMVASHANRALHGLSRGRVPALMSPYRALSTWQPRTFSGDALRALGFRQPLSESAALDDGFASLG